MTISLESRFQTIGGRGSSLISNLLTIDQKDEKRTVLDNCGHTYAELHPRYLQAESWAEGTAETSPTNNAVDYYDTTSTTYELISVTELKLSADRTRLVVRADHDSIDVQVEILDADTLAVLDTVVLSGVGARVEDLATSGEIGGTEVLVKTSIRAEGGVAGYGLLYDLYVYEDALDELPGCDTGPATSYATWDSTRRSAASITASGLTSGFGSTPSNLIDGLHGENGTDGHIATAWGAGDYYQIDMGTAVICDGLRVWVGDDVTWPAGAYTQRVTLQASNDATFTTGVVTLATGVELGDGGNVSAGTYLTEADTADSGNWRRTYGWTKPGTAYRYFRLLYESGAGYAFWYTTEIAFKVDA